MRALPPLRTLISSRPSLLFVATLSHVLLILLLGHLIVLNPHQSKTIFAASRSIMEDEVVVLPEPPEEDVLDPTNTLTGETEGANSPIATSVAGGAAPELLTTTQDVPSLMPATVASDPIGRSIGNGKGIGSGRGNGKSRGPVLTKMLGGMEVADNIVIVLDVSGSMSEYVSALEAQIAQSFPNAKIGRALSAYGGATDAPDETQTRLFSGMDAMGDLYAAAYQGLKENPGATGVYILSDFADGDTESSTALFLKRLREKNLKLYLCYTDKRPYAKLRAYAESTGDCKKFQKIK